MGYFNAAMLEAGKMDHTRCRYLSTGSRPSAFGHHGLSIFKIKGTVNLKNYFVGKFAFDLIVNAMLKRSVGLMYGW